MTAPSRPLALRASLGFAAALVFALALHPACSSDEAPGVSDAGSDAGNPGDGGKIGCTRDLDCPTARWCEKSTGICRDAKACPQGQGNCDYQSTGSDYCDNQTCYCDPDDTSCKPLRLPCAPCTKSEQCGNDKQAFDHVADCLPASAGFNTVDSCIPRRDGYLGCPQGFTQATDGGVYCTPAGGKCGAQGRVAAANHQDVEHLGGHRVNP